MLVVKFECQNNAIASTAESANESSSITMKAPNFFNNKIDQQELSVLKHLVFVPENMLNINRDIVCQYRPIN
jgi:fructose-1,6-bisphosphatase